MTKISFIMASYLGSYSQSAGDRISKFHRALKSFLSQSYTNSELIIVSDGCYITNEECAKYNDARIKLIPIEKQPVFSGNVRSYGCFLASGDIIAYLDTDDFLGTEHAQAIVNGFNYHKQASWVFFDDKIVWRFNPSSKEILIESVREVKPEFGLIGTSSIAHKKSIGIDWRGCDGYGHDWTFINKLILSGNEGVKIDGCQYYVCHIPNSVDS